MKYIRHRNLNNLDLVEI